jgi:hypothetical protein
VPRQQIERLARFRAGRDRQHRREKSNNSRRLLFVPPEDAAFLAVNNVAQVTLASVALQVAGDQPSVDKITRERRDRIIWVLP